MKTFKTLYGADFMNMRPDDVAALLIDELVELAGRGRALFGTIAAYIEAADRKNEAVAATSPIIATATATTTTTMTTTASIHPVSALALSLVAVIPSSTTTLHAMLARPTATKDFQTLSGADLMKIKLQRIVTLSNDDLVLLVLRIQELMSHSPIKPGCR
jgi:hypothetical protein